MNRERTPRGPSTSSGTGSPEVRHDHPGKRTLTEAMVQVQMRSSPRSVAPPVASAAPTGASSVALETLFGGHVQHARNAPAARASSTDEVHAAAARGIATPASALPHADTLQRAFGRHDLSSIRAHVGPGAASSAHDMGAEAYATGNHVVFGGTPDLHTAAHEAAHVIQQRAGIHLKGGVGELGDPHERHADEVADRVVRGESVAALLDPYVPGAGGSAVVQHKKPGDAPPTISAQLEQRLAVRDEGQGNLPTEQQLVDELDALFMSVAQPAAVTNVAELVDKAICGFAFSPLRSATSDLMTLQMALVTLAQQELVQHPALVINVPQILAQIDATVQPLVRQGVTAWCTLNTQPVPSNTVIDSTYHIDLSGAGTGGANEHARRFLVDHPQQVGFTGALTLPQETQLSSALMNMSVVKRARSGKHAEIAQLRAKGSTQIAAWLEPRVEVDDESDRGGGNDVEDALITAHDVPSGTRSRIQKAGEIVSSLVEPNVLMQAGDPVVYVHIAKDRTLLEKIHAGDFSAAKMKRAYSEGYAKAIHIDHRDPVDTIVHEMGHQLENLLPTELWLDIQRMLHGRHQLAVTSGQPDNLISIYPSHKDLEVRKESAYRADMPATGTYSAKVYDGPGATEVMSMSMQFLSDPSSAKQLIEKDPLQAAIILRGIAPAEFAMTVPGNLKALLPS